MTGEEGFKFCIDKIPFNSVLDIGCGFGDHFKAFQQAGKQVIGVDIIDNGFNVVGDYLDTSFNPVDLIWASHILEHQLNVNLFLRKCYSDLNENGYICITVPPLKHNIVGGHVTLWNAGLVMYNLVLAGFDCSNVKIKQYGYNISVIAQKGGFKLPPLNYDNGDIELISQWLPNGYNYQNFNGNISEFNWT